MNSKVVPKILKQLNYELISDNVDLDREVEGLSINRAGMQLTVATLGLPYKKYIIGWGTAEARYIKSLKPKDREARIRHVITTETPLLVLSEGFSDFDDIKELIVKIATELGVPTVNPNERLANIITTFSTILSHINATPESVHGSLVIINGIGVMLIGQSGIGKSEAVLELIQDGHTFVSDDTVEIIKNGTKFIGRAAELTKGLLEARGIGLVNVPFIYGARSTKYETNIDLVVELVPEKELNTVDRLGDQNLTYEVAGGFISKIQIPTASGRSIASLIVAASNVYTARAQGMDPLKTIKERRDK